MFQLRSIAARLILAISLTVAAACGILGTFSIIQERALMRLALDQQLKLQYDSVIAAIDYEGRAALAGSAVVGNLATGVEPKKPGKPIVGVEAGRDSLSIFAMTPLMRDGKSMAVADIGVSFGKQFVDNVKQRFGVDLAVHRFDGKAFTRISSTR